MRYMLLSCFLLSACQVPPYLKFETSQLELLKTQAQIEEELGVPTRIYEENGVTYLIYDTTFLLPSDTVGSFFSFSRKRFGNYVVSDCSAVFEIENEVVKTLYSHGLCL